MVFPRTVEAVIFDMDGLIFDTEALYQRAFQTVAIAGKHDLPETVIQLTLGSPWVRSRAMLIEQMGNDFPVDRYGEQVKVEFEALAKTQLKLKPGVIELLNFLDEHHRPRGIATSSERILAQAHLNAHNLTDRFHVVVSHGDYALSKPAPDAFLETAKKLGVDPARCAALEDSHNGVRAAYAAGMMTVMVPDLLPANEEMRDLCAFIASDLHEVVRRLATQF